MENSFLTFFTIFTDQSGNVFSEPMFTVFKLKYPVDGQMWDWQVLDWLGQRLLSGKSKVEDALVLPELSLGYYRLQVKKDGDCEWQNTIPFARVTNPSDRRMDSVCPYNMDSAQSTVVPPYPADNALQPPDTYRVISDLEKLAGFSMVRDRISWEEVNPQPGTYCWGKYLTNARLLAERGIKILNVFHDAPDWVKEGQQSMPSNLLALYQFSKDAALEFCG